MFRKIARKFGPLDVIRETASFANSAKNGRWYDAGGETLLTTIYTDQIIAVDRNDLSLAPHLLLKGVWEMELTGRCERLVSDLKNPVILDVGANFGWYGLILSRFSSESRIHFFEANPHLVSLIQKTLSVNGLLSRAAIINSAVGSDDESIVTLSVPRSHLGSASVRGLAPEQLAMIYEDESEMHSFKVQMCTLDRYCATAGIASIDFLKIDVEGSEGDVLLGAKNIIKSSPRLNIMMEWNRGCYADDVMSIVKEFSACEGLSSNGALVDLTGILHGTASIDEFEAKVMSALSKTSPAADLFFMKR